MASDSVVPKPAAALFTKWGRGVDAPDLQLWIQHGHRVIESVWLNIQDLPDRPELVSRMPLRMRNRMLWEAREVRKGNTQLSPDFPGYSSESVGEGDHQFPPLRKNNSGQLSTD